MIVTKNVSVVLESAKCQLKIQALHRLNPQISQYLKNALWKISPYARNPCLGRGINNSGRPRVKVPSVENRFTCSTGLTYFATKFTLPSFNWCFMVAALRQWQIRAKANPLNQQILQNKTTQITSWDKYFANKNISTSAFKFSPTGNSYGEENHHHTRKTIINLKVAQLRFRGLLRCDKKISDYKCSHV